MIWSSLPIITITAGHNGRLQPSAASENQPLMISPSREEGGGSLLWPPRQYNAPSQANDWRRTVSSRAQMETWEFPGLGKYDWTIIVPPDDLREIDEHRKIR